MIIQIRNKLYDSMKETIGMRLTNREIAMITHHYISNNPPECIFVLNGSRKDTSCDDALLTSAESQQFIKRLKNFLKKNYPETKKLSGVEIQ